MFAGAEFIRKFARPQLAPGGKNDVEQDFKSLARHVPHRLLKQFAAQCKEPGHRIRKRRSQNRFLDHRGELADQLAVLRPVAEPAPARVAGADGEVECRVFAECRQHLRKDFFIVLQVGVHHGKDLRRTRRHAFKTGRGQAAASDSPDGPHAGMRAAQLKEHIGRAVVRVVVHKYDFPVELTQQGIQPRQHQRNVLTLPECGNNDSDGKRLAHEAGGLEGTCKGIFFHTVARFSIKSG